MTLLKRMRGRLALLASALLTFLLSLPAMAAVQPESGWGLPRDVSLDGHRIDWLINITMVFLIILFVIMVVWMGIAIIKHGRHHTAELDYGNAKKQVIKGLVLSTVIFIIVDGNLWVNSVIDVDEVFWNHEAALAQPNAVRVEVNGHQWAWDFRYPGPDDQFNTADDIVTMHELRVPVNAPVVMQLGASDVIHSLSFPNLRVKQDAIPGNVTPLWFQAVETGEFEIACAQHCGTHHYKMKGKLIIMPEADYATWQEEASIRGALAYNPDDVEAHWGWPWQEI